MQMSTFSVPPVRYRKGTEKVQKRRRACRQASSGEAQLRYRKGTKKAQGMQTGLEWRGAVEVRTSIGGTKKVQKRYSKGTEKVHFELCKLVPFLYLLRGMEKVQKRYTRGAGHADRLDYLVTTEVQKRYRKGTEKVQERYRKGTRMVQKRYRKGTEKVQGQ